MENIRKLIEDSALQLVSLEPDDLPALADLHTLFEKINEQAKSVKRNIPETEFYKQMSQAATQAAQSIETIILRETENARQTLDSINSMAQSLQELAAKIFDFKELPSAPATAQPESARPAPINHQLPENVDEQIFREFLANQPFVLENLESAVLNAEKDPSIENQNALKAILHSIKGETGLMGLEALSRQCHDMESLLENSPATIPAEKLLTFKDACLQTVNQFIQNGVAIVSASNSDKSPQVVEKKPESPPAAAAPADSSDKESFTIAAGDVPLVMDFVNESNEHLESAEADLLSLEDNPDNHETVNSIFRAFHTIKGVAGFLNLKQIGSLAHATENLLDLARKGTLALTGPCVDVVFEAIDIEKKMIASLRSAVESSSPVQPYSGLHHVIDRIKALSSGQTPPPRTGDILVDMKASTRKEVDSAAWQQAQESPEKKIGEILVDQEQATSQQVEQALQIQKDLNEKSQTPPAASTTASKVSADSTVKVTTSRLDALINMVGELVIAQAMVSQGMDQTTLQDQRLERNLRHLTKITRDLQELSMSMRMVPVQGVFQKMARLIRDLSHKADKSIDFVMAGAETELDRNVVEAIADPLVHMIRNSIDHGIEPPQDRLKAGKSPTGKVELKAYHQGGNIVIEIADDGRGLNKDKILQKAMKNGIVKEGQDISEQEIFRLIFHAGLSTAEKITDISGRGVGMDVVRKNIESLRGRVDIQSVLGKGTTFRIALPLTLAVIDGQVITIGSQRYIIPTTSIEQNLRPAPDQLSSLQGGKAEMVMIRGSLLPLIRLYDLFRIQSKFEDPCEGLLVVVADGERRACLLVDSLLGQQQVVIKSLGNYLGSIKGISGSAIMGDGNVSLILDIPGLIKLSTATAAC